MLTARLNRLGLSPGDRVLDLGCGEGRHVHGLYLLGGLEIIGVDLNQASLDKAAEGLATLVTPELEAASNVSFETGDATNLRFEDGYFDAVICSEVLEHLPDYDAAISEMRRVLKPDGRLCVSVPHAWPERICWQLAPPPNGYAFEPGGHIRIFDEVDLKVSIERHGFKLSKRHHAHGIHVPYWWLKCAFWDRDDEHPWVKAFHNLLVWDLMKKPWITRALDTIISPVMGKSLVLYFDGSESA